MLFTEISSSIALIKSWLIKRRKVALYVVCAVASSLLFQCEDDSPSPDNTPSGVEISITADRTTVKLPFEKGSFELEITASGKNWSIQENISWLEAVKMNPTTLKGIYEKNEGAERKAEFTATIEEEIINITVIQQANQHPSFADKTISAQIYTEEIMIPNLTLPEAQGGNGTLTYSLTPSLPNGLDFDEDTRVLSGTPSAGTATPAKTYTYTVNDSAEGKSTLQFTITVEADVGPMFGSTAVLEQIYTERLTIHPLTLPAAQGGNGTLTYGLTPDLPAGLSFDPATRVLSGAPFVGTAAPATEYTFTATDADGDEATRTISITIRTLTSLITLSSETLDVSVTSTSDNTITITSSVDWIASSSGDLMSSVWPTSGTASATAQTIVLRYTANTTHLMRTSTITFTEVTPGASPPFTVELTVKQAAVPLPSGVIPITYLEQLHAMRYDADGDGKVTGIHAQAYADAFPAVVSTNKYTGYELAKDLDFNDNNSYSNPTINKPRWTKGDGSSMGWNPVGGNDLFMGVFNGRGYTISNLYIHRNTPFIGLFGYVGGEIRNVGLVNPNVTSTRQANATVGCLAGAASRIEISNCYVSGGTLSTGNGSSVGGLVGRHTLGTIRSCYVSNTISAGGNSANVGGLIGEQASTTIIACYVSNGTSTGDDSANVGGLVGQLNGGTIRACYVSNQTTTGDNSANIGGLLGNHRIGAIIACYAGGKDYDHLKGFTNTVFSSSITITDSYHQLESGSTEDSTSKFETTLKSPITYGAGTSIYADWNVDVDGYAGGDDPWDFGTNSQYPVLKVDFDKDGSTINDVRRQRGA